MNWYRFFFPPLLFLSGLGIIFMQISGGRRIYNYQGPRYETEMLAGYLVASWSFWCANMAKPFLFGVPLSIAAIATMISMHEYQWVITFTALFLYAIVSPDEIEDSVLFGCNLMFVIIFLTIEFSQNLFHPLSHAHPVVKVE